MARSLPVHSTETGTTVSEGKELVQRDKNLYRKAPVVVLRGVVRSASTTIPPRKKDEHAPGNDSGRVLAGDNSPNGM
jgi:hypothetical protein